MGEPSSLTPIGVIVHDFQTRLAESQELSDEPAWVDLYRKTWPNMIACVRIDKDSVYQRWGVDREVLLATGQRITVDEKKRRKDYRDMCIEEWSVFHGPNDARNKIGWTLDLNKRCDYIAYAVVPASRCYLLPFDLLRRTARRFLDDWKKRYQPPRPAVNKSYVTVNVGVPWNALWRDMRATSEADFTGTLALPQPFQVRDQLLFDWNASNGERS